MKNMSGMAALVATGLLAVGCAHPAAPQTQPAPRPVAAIPSSVVEPQAHVPATIAVQPTVHRTARRAQTVTLARKVTRKSVVRRTWVAPATSCSALSTFVNSKRRAYGLPALRYSPTLTRVANAWAWHLSRVGVLSHNNSVLRGLIASGGWQWAGENVGYSPALSTMNAAFWHSPEHRANILDHDYTRIGVGCVKVNGRIWASVTFGTPA